MADKCCVENLQDKWKPQSTPLQNNNLGNRNVRSELFRLIRNRMSIFMVSGSNRMENSPKTWRHEELPNCRVATFTDYYRSSIFSWTSQLTLLFSTHLLRLHPQSALSSSVHSRQTHAPTAGPSGMFCIGFAWCLAMGAFKKNSFRKANNNSRRRQANRIFALRTPWIWNITMS